MKNQLDLTGLNLQPIPLRRWEMSQAMWVLDDLLQRDSDNDDDGAHAAATAVVSPERQSRSTNTHAAESTAAYSLAAFDDINDDIDDADHLSVACIKAFDDEHLAEINNSNSDNNNLRAYSVPPSDYSRNYPTTDEAPHHTSSSRDYPFHATADHHACYYYPPNNSNNNKKNNAGDADCFSPDRPYTCHQGQPLTEQVSADPRRPFLRHNLTVQPSWRQFPNYYHSHSASFSAPTTTSTSNHMMHSAYSTIDRTATYSSRPYFPPQRWPPQSGMTMPPPPYTYSQSSRPVVSPTSNNSMGEFPQPPPPTTTDTGSSAATRPQPQEEQKEKQQRSNNMKPKAPVSKSKKQASKTASKKGSPKKIDRPKLETCLRPIHHEKWQRRFHDLLVFKQQHGHCLVPIAYGAVPTLPNWVKRQRNQYKKKIVGEVTTLTDERQQILDNVGFVWDSHQALWTLRLRECHQFRIQHGHCCIPVRYPHNSMLAVWAKCQRRQFKLYRKGGKSALTVSRINALNDLGFVWNPFGPRP